MHTCHTTAMTMTKLTLVLLLVFPFLLAQPLAAQQQRGPTTVILVRHAEKAAMPASDPPLTKQGQRRARALAELARDGGVTAIITTPYVRTRSTAAPAAEELHLTLETVNPSAAETAKRILAEHAGEVVLVVGHSNTVPAIVAALGASEPPSICDSEYDGLYVVTVPASGAAHVIRARYGEPSPVAAGCGRMKR